MGKKDTKEDFAINAENELGQAVFCNLNCHTGRQSRIYTHSDDELGLRDVVKV